LVYSMHRSRHRHDLPSFPTRRSSDLRRALRIEVLDRDLERLAVRPDAHPVAALLEAEPVEQVVGLLGVVLGPDLLHALVVLGRADRKSTRLNSSHGSISYAVFCLKKK